MPITAMPPKAPDENLDYKIDLTQELKGRLSGGSDDTLASVTWNAPAPLMTTATSFDASTATIWLSSGTLGKMYEVAATFQTTGGRTYKRSFTLTISDR